MTGLKIHKERCTGCGQCVHTCPVEALLLEKGKVQVDRVLCTICSMCVDSCPFQALSIEKTAAGTGKPSRCQGVWIYAEERQGEIHPVALELLGVGQKLAKNRGCQVTALLLGSGSEDQAQSLISHGADRVFVWTPNDGKSRQEACLVAVMDHLMSSEKPEIFLFGATGLGRSLAPRVAARLRTGLTADCTQLEIDEETGLIHQTRPAFGGNLMATIICPDHRPQMASVRPGVMKPALPDDTRRGEVIPVLFQPDRDQSLQVLEEIALPPVPSIAGAQVIVSAGRGIGNQKNMALIHRLAELLDAQVGVSRPLVDTGWSEYRHQIGQTGSMVKPKLLIACGISGAIQHLAGMSGAETIIAINNDPEAPIFSVAHYKVVGDCVEVLKQLIKNLEEGRGQIFSLTR